MNEIPPQCPATMPELQVMIRKVCEWIESASQIKDVIEHPGWETILVFLTSCIPG